MKVGQYQYSNINYLTNNHEFGDYTVNGSVVTFATNSTISKNSKLFFSLNIPVFEDYEAITINIKNGEESKLALKFTLPKKSDEMEYTVIKFGLINKIDFDKLEIVFATKTITTGLDEKLQINKCQDIYNIFSDISINITKAKQTIQKIAFEGPQGLIIILNNSMIKLSDSGVLELLNNKIFNTSNAFLGLAIEPETTGKEKIRITYQY